MFIGQFSVLSFFLCHIHTHTHTHTIHTNIQAIIPLICVTDDYRFTTALNILKLVVDQYWGAYHSPHNTYTELTTQDDDVNVPQSKSLFSPLNSQNAPPLPEQMRQNSAQKMLNRSVLKSDMPSQDAGCVAEHSSTPKTVRKLTASKSETPLRSSGLSQNADNTVQVHVHVHAAGQNKTAQNLTRTVSKPETLPGSRSSGSVQNSAPVKVVKTSSRLSLKPDPHSLSPLSPPAAVVEATPPEKLVPEEAVKMALRECEAYLAFRRHDDIEGKVCVYELLVNTVHVHVYTCNIIAYI